MLYCKIGRQHVINALQLGLIVKRDLLLPVTFFTQKCFSKSHDAFIYAALVES